MLFYVKCPSCSSLIGTQFGKYSEELKTIINDPTLSAVEKNNKNSKLLDKYNYTNICCRIRILGTIPYHEIVVT